MALSAKWPETKHIISESTISTVPYLNLLLLLCSLLKPQLTAELAGRLADCLVVIQYRRRTGGKEEKKNAQKINQRLQTSLSVLVSSDSTALSVRSRQKVPNVYPTPSEAEGSRRRYRRREGAPHRTAPHRTALHHTTPE